MIITKQKDKADILKYLEGEDRIFIFGCGECATVCKTGGEKEVEDMKKFLEANGKAKQSRGFNNYGLRAWCPVPKREFEGFEASSYY
jgi:hypothetical protein